jgi:predicted transcriptional regulator
MRREALNIEKSSLLKDLKSISPKVSTYNKIVTRIKEIDKLLQHEPIIQEKGGQISRV